MSDDEISGLLSVALVKLTCNLKRANSLLEHQIAVAGIGGGSDPLARPLRITFFEDVAALTKSENEVSLRELVELVRTSSAPDKGTLSLLKLAKFGKQRSKKGSLRYDANLLSIDGIEGDYDAERMSFNEAKERLKANNVAALIYTSPSHTPEKPRWRVLCPTSRTLEPCDHTRLVARLNGILAGTLAGESFTRSQTYYFGFITGNAAHQVETVEGRAIDVADDLDSCAIGRDGASPSNLADSENLFADDMETSNLGLKADAEVVASALAAIPNDGPPDWNRYNTLLMAAWAATDGSDDGRDAALLSRLRCS